MITVLWSYVPCRFIYSFRSILSTSVGQTVMSPGNRDKNGLALMEIDYS